MPLAFPLTLTPGPLKCPPVSTSQVEFSVATEALAPALSRRDRWIDLFFVLGIALWQLIYASTTHAISHLPMTVSNSNQRVTFSALTEVAGIATLIYVLWMRTAGVSSLTKAPGWDDLPSGVGLYFVAFLSALVVGFLLRFGWILTRGPLPPRVSPGQMLGMEATLAWLFYQFLNPRFEELIVRGFLMTELSALVGVRTAIIAGTLVQISYHLYQGVWNVCSVGVIFLVYSLYYARTRRLMPIILAHTLQDLVAWALYTHHTLKTWAEASIRLDPAGRQIIQSSQLHADPEHDTCHIIPPGCPIQARRWLEWACEKTHHPPKKVKGAYLQLELQHAQRSFLSEPVPPVNLIVNMYGSAPPPLLPINNLPGACPPFRTRPES
jgi:membrane protease YdiL (CAAX protease family)